MLALPAGCSGPTSSRTLMNAHASKSSRCNHSSMDKPEGCQNPDPSRCGLVVVLMDEASESIPSLDRRADDRGATGGRRSWRTSAERAVRTLAVVVIEEDTQDPLELARSEDQHPVEALRPHGAHEALSVSVRSRRPGRSPYHPDAVAAEDLVEAGEELRVAIMDQEPRVLKHARETALRTIRW